MPGLGTAPLGQFPLGFGTPDESTDLAAALHRGSRFIDPKTLDYAVDSATGTWKVSTPAQQALQLKLGAERGSGSALPQYGIPMPETMTDSTLREITQSIRTAMAAEIADKVLTIDDVRLTTDPTVNGRAVVDIDYTDLSTNQRDTFTLG